ncbi:hypothetical protein EJ04DRAFT_552646 [Polyplosphaeria fusca]|uniref:Heterokaryon incompatibility domain-containing protein n=1 Tax=Polyplosphaeria fusca TaxID=682080 RepID=A0A9P4QZV3_9PLEO|nr:hypothetical protein EJ04DRAFT_552646 [Polyplosphaeria fusca]
MLSFNHYVWRQANFRLPSNPADTSEQHTPTTHPHRCEHCNCIFLFEANKYELLPYKDSKSKCMLGNIVRSAHRGSLFNQWLLDFVCARLGDDAGLFANHCKFEIELRLVRVFESDIVPHGPNQEGDRRLKWDGHDRILSNRLELFIYYKYQAACSPYDIEVTARVQTLGGAWTQGSETLHMSRPLTEIGRYTILNTLACILHHIDRGQLHIRYLWVDALCILQDSREDQVHELQRMSSYYQNGVLTICAASASSSSDGFLRPADVAYEVGPFEVIFEEGPKLPPAPKGIPDEDHWSTSYYTNDERNRISSTSTRSLVQLYKFKDETAPNEPISSRAWTFQEALLSSRLLIFATQQFYWCCGATFVGCGGIDSFDKREVLIPDCGGQEKQCICGVSLIRQIDRPDLVPGVFTLANRNTMSTDAQWDMITESYSGRLLTLESDKLPALSAAAAYFDTLFRMRWPDVRYAAGMFYSEENPRWFIRQLLWRSHVIRKVYGSFLSYTRPTDYYAPTWSWASVKGHVKQFDRMMMNYCYFHVDLKILDISTDLMEGQATCAFGSIKTARLIVRGRLKLIDSSVERRGSINFVAGRRKYKVFPDTIPDYNHIAAGRTDFTISTYVLEVVSHTGRCASPHGLVLARHEESTQSLYNGISVFRRLGVFEAKDADHADDADHTFFDDTEQQKICII